MNKEMIKKGAEIIERTAKLHGTDTGNVRSELERAIREGMSNPDPQVQSFWKQYRKTCGEPMPETLILYLSGLIR